MTDRRELEALVAKARARGAEVEVTEDHAGYVDSIRVWKGLPGVGPYPMSPLSAAERLREALN